MSSSLSASVEHLTGNNDTQVCIELKLLYLFCLLEMFNEIAREYNNNCSIVFFLCKQKENCEFQYLICKSIFIRAENQFHQFQLFSFYFYFTKATNIFE